MATLFELFSVIAWIVSLFAVNQATFGIWCVATACWIAILVRLYEADKQHKKLLEVIAARKAEP